MSCLVWNVRGLGSARAFHELRRLLAGVSPSLVFLCETKITNFRSNNWRTILGYSGHFVVDAVGKKGGLMLLWREPMQVQILSYSQGHIDCMIESDNYQWRFTGFYGNPEKEQRRFSGDLLRKIHRSNNITNLAWIVGGDFNEILCETEKKGGRTRPISQLQGFREVIQHCHLCEFKKEDRAFMWFNKRKGADAIFERLDRYFANSQWQNLFPEATPRTLDFFGSDHRPILCELMPHERVLRKGKGRFHWEDKWLLEKNFVQDFLVEWENSREQNNLPTRLSACANFLKNWAGSRFDQLGKKISRLRKQRQRMMEDSGSKNPAAEILNLSREIEANVEKEVYHWQQRARMTWLKEGDRNTKVFHSQASKRRAKNYIHGLVDKRGEWKTDEHGKALTITKYFESLFQTTNPSSQDIQEVIRCIEKRISTEQHDFLSTSFTADEVKTATFNINPTKAPGPDGFSGRFFQKFWPAIGDYLTNQVLRVMNEGASIREWNETIIALIPKYDEPKFVKDFRPISLCNTIYKIVSKIIVQRLRKIMPDIVDETQSGFVPGRLISDNVLVGFESLHWLRKHQHRRTGYIALKLDMSKAYDRVEWVFLKETMIKVGLPMCLVDLVMRCVTSVSFFFTMNNTVYGNIIPTQGLRQGDPLSPFLFVMCSQGLSSILTHQERNGCLHGIPLIPRSPSITHLFFADDSLVFFKGTRDECLVIKKCLQNYEKASGQSINFEKSAVTLSPSTSRDAADMVRRLLNIREVEGHRVYLGLPTFTMRQKRTQFGYIRERVQKKLMGWQNKNFSAGGKEVLLKSVVQAIPTYTMSCFRIPDSICADINRMCARFWWGDDKEHRHMHWTKWTDLCKPKEKGGMGFRNLNSFNKAMLAKQVWRMIHNPTSLVAKVFKARYFAQCDIMEAEIGSSASYVWRSLAWSRTLLCNGMFWRVGNGQNIRAFRDAWIPNSSAGVLTKESERSEDVMVADLIVSRQWDVRRLEQVCWPYEMEIVKSLEIGNVTDKRWWKFEEHGIYSVKSGYLLGIGYYNPPQYTISTDKKMWSRLVWSLKVPPKIRVFAWRAYMDFIPMENNLLRHHVPTNGICSLCGLYKGTTEHCLIFCSKISNVWKDSSYWIFLKKCKHLSFLELGEFMCHELSNEKYEVWIILLWMTWRYICELKHSRNRMAYHVWEEQGLMLWKTYQDSRNIEGVTPFLGVQKGAREWIKPEVGFRVDVDAMYNTQTNKYGVGVIVRDAKGGIIVAMSRPLVPWTGTVMGAEIKAVIHGILLCMEEKIKPIIIYTDSLLTARVMKDEESEIEVISSDIQEARELAKHNFVVGVRHAYRSVNQAAHCLAHFSAQITSQMIWRSCFPDWLMQVVTQDI